MKLKKAKRLLRKEQQFLKLEAAEARMSARMSGLTDAKLDLVEEIANSEREIAAHQAVMAGLEEAIVELDAEMVSVEVLGSGSRPVRPMESDLVEARAKVDAVAASAAERAAWESALRARIETRAIGSGFGARLLVDGVFVFDGGATAALAADRLVAQLRGRRARRVMSATQLALWAS